MDTILPLRCYDVLGGAIDHETPTGLVTIASVERRGDPLLVRLNPAGGEESLGRLDGIEVRDRNDLQRRLEARMWPSPCLPPDGSGEGFEDGRL